MSGRQKQPLWRQVRILLRGTDSRFQIPLDSYMRETSKVILLGYTVLNTPVTGTVPVTPIIALDFEQSPGFELTPQLSNLPLQDSIVLALVGVNTQRDCSSGIVIGQLRGSKRHIINMRVRDVDGVEHNASSHKLFDWLTLEMAVLEAGMDLTPPDLMKIPSIQAVLDTI